MISRTVDGQATAPWRRELARAVRDPEELLDLLGLSPADVGWDDDALAAHRYFPLRVPRGFVARMRPGDPDDPLLRQVLPVSAEASSPEGWSHDPLAESLVAPVPGLLHKYHGRVLSVTTGACAVHCRYCFRRHFPYAEQRAIDPDFASALEHIAGDASISEVILSGGDPLTLTDDKLGRLAERLAAIGHVERLRVHTRLPIVLPERVDDALVAWLTGTRLRPIVVVHANHANEIDRPVGRGVELLVQSGVPVLNQSVLLRGVNDSVSALRDLSETLFRMHVLPYYLHVLDRVEGAAHHEVDPSIATDLVRRLAAEVPGYLVPRLVREDPGAPAKTSIR